MNSAFQLRIHVSNLFVQMPHSTDTHTHTIEMDRRLLVSFHVNEIVERFKLCKSFLCSTCWWIFTINFSIQTGSGKVNTPPHTDQPANSCNSSGFCCCFVVEVTTHQHKVMKVLYCLFVLLRINIKRTIHSACAVCCGFFCFCLSSLLMKCFMNEINVGCERH